MPEQIIDLTQKNVIKSIINLRCREGANLKYIQGEYEEEVGPWPLPKNDFKQNVKFINGIEGVNCVKEQSGALKWFIESAKSKHVAQLIINQHKNNGNGDSYGNGNKPKTHGSKFNCTAPSCFYKDNVTYLHKRRYNGFNKVNVNKTMHAQNSPTAEKEETYDAQLIGDDFLLSLASCDSGKKLFMRNNGRYSGLSSSGLTIQAATELIETSDKIKSSILIINVGLIDIINCCDDDIAAICDRYRNLINVCKRRNIQPVITTLAPFCKSNNPHVIRYNMSLFNEFLIDEYCHDYLVIDIWSKMVTPGHLIRLDLVQANSSNPSNSNKLHTFWNEKSYEDIFKYIQLNLRWFFKKQLTIAA